ncbi:MAG TPA: hypothetical protein VK518_08735 [Puia sp.]|nr:hypothetical protein [Puia sp.]
MRAAGKGVISSDLIGWKADGNNQENGDDLVDVGNLYNLVITITTKPGLGKLVRCPMASVSEVFMPRDKFVQENFWGNAKGKDHKQHSA